MKFRGRTGLRRFAGFSTCVAFAAATLLFLAPAALTGPVTGAVNTTDDPNWNGPADSGTLLGAPTQACLNGPPGHTSPAVNCNIYQSKTDVFLSGSPTPAAVGAGTYFFAVLVPGGQPDPNDGGAKNLSDTVAGPGATPGGGDLVTNREFSSDGNGPITPLGNSSHAYDALNNVLQVAPYDDTTNPGGVYILATCKISDSQNAFQDPVPTVDPKNCKYDAFKVKESETNPASDLTLTKTAVGSFDRTFPWTIQKDVDKTEVDQSGADATFHYTITVTKGAPTDGNYQVNGTITVFNPNLDQSNNPVPVDHVTVTDAVDNGGDCVVTNGSDVTISGSSADLAYTCTYSSDPLSLSGTNTATVSWQEQDLSTGHLPAGSANFSVDFNLDANDVNNCITVTDTLGGSLGQFCDSGTASYDYTFHNQPAGTCTSHDNTAVIDQTGDSASQTVEVCRGADLTVSKDANPAFSRLYRWSINKAVDKTKVTLLNGSATFNYTVTVTETGFTDSGWGVTGTITVNNPNDWETVPVTISDAVNNGGNCTVTTPTQTVPKATDATHPGQVTSTYSCTWSAAPSSSSGINTATITWDGTAAHTPHGSATGTAGFAFTTPTSTTNKTIHVTDTYAGALGDATAVDSPPLTSKQFTYARTIPAPATGCATYPNTARISETNQTSSQSVQVCRVPPQTGALTMGFWKNKNGQNIIKADGSTGGVCNLATWLKQYAPFQDITTTQAATCTGTAGYVANVLNAATCGGSTCNAMLKAQMLATALDVYFSASGNNKIGASSPIGARNIDLTVICQMIDGSSSSTCSGTYYSVSSAFGGATCMSVSAMLTYAASQSNVGGSTWYLQVKATQVKAKDAFDSINNVVAFQC